MSKPTASSAGLGSLASGAITAVALAVQTGLAAIVGVVLARDFGRTGVTDGFFAAYAVFIVVILAANAIRLTVLPVFARARDENRLAGELAVYAVSLAVFTVPVFVVSLLAAHPIAGLLTRGAPAQHTAAAALPWMVGAGILQLYAALAASALAALNDYVVAAAGFALGSAAGLGLILLRVHHNGIAVLSWGMALNGAVALGIQGFVLVRRARSERMPRSAVRPSGAVTFRARASNMASGVALPLSLQAIYLVCLPFASREGVGAVSSFSYAYLISSAVVAVAGTSLGLVTSVPLTRAGMNAAGAARHIVASSWIGLLVIGGAAGVFGLAGGRIVTLLLGKGYAAHVGKELGGLVVSFAPWTAVSIAVAVAYPLVFVAQRVRRLPLLALGALVVHVPIAWAGERLDGLDGLALALAVTTCLILAAILLELGALAETLRRLGLAALLIAGLAGLAYGLPRTVLAPTLAAAVGLALYCVLVALVRPKGLRVAWHYLRALE